MAKKENFYQTPVDRTPYSALVTIALIGIALFAAGSLALVRAGGWVQQKIHITTPSLSVPSLTSDPFAGAQAQLENLQQQSKDAAASELQKQQDDLKQEAADTVRTQANQQINTLKGLVP